MKMHRIMPIILLVLVLLVIFLAFSTTKFAFAQGGTVNVTVNISRVAQMNILPAWLVWNLTTPGTDGGNKTIDVKNSGSLNLTNLYAWINTNETERFNPLAGDAATGFARNYSSGGFIAMANDTYTLGWNYVGRQEWNITYTPTGASITAMSTTITNRSVGYFRNITNEYLWQVYNGSNATCNSTNAVLRVSKVADIGETSTRDMTTATSYDAGTFVEGTGIGAPWGVFTFSAGAWKDVCVAAYWDCSKIYIYKYDYRSTGSGGVFSGACGKRNYLTTDNLKPGEVRIYNLRAWVPYGIPAGNTTAAVLTILASSL